MVFRRFVSNRSNRNEKDKSLNLNTSMSRLSILEINETMVYWFWYDYIKPKY